MTARQALLDAAATRILLTDGAFGTEIQNWKLAEADYMGDLALAKDAKGNNDILALTKPSVMSALTASLARRSVSRFTGGGGPFSMPAISRSQSDWPRCPNG